MNKNEFVEKNYKLIASACKKYHKMCSGYIEFEDFYNNCCLLFLTRKSFNSDINTKPSPFVYKVVLMEALTIIRRNHSQKRKISQGDLMSLDFDFTGLEKKLQNLSKKASRETIDEALKAGGEVLLDEMRKNVPVRTGELKSSLGEIRKSGTGLKRKSVIGINSDDRKIVERGYYQEHGTRRMIGKKWMKRSSQNSKKEAIQAVANSLKENLKG